VGTTHAKTAIACLAVLTLLALVPVELPVGAGAATCTTTVTSVGGAASAAAGAAAGSTVCLADGSYGRLDLKASKAAPGVVVRAENPGGATIAGASMAGSNLTVAQFKIQGGTVSIEPSSTGMTVDHNLLVGTRSSYGVFVCPGSSSARCSDVTISANRFQGAFSEDQIQANLYHDADGDGEGLLVEGNEFLGNVEWGDHDDVFQSVWGGDHLVFRKNYLHDFGGQGFFVKDQPATIDGMVVEDNLIVRQNLPCDPTSLCPTWQLSPFQVFGPLRDVRIRHNTVWPGSGGGTQWLRGSGWQGPTVVADNVFSNLNSDAGGLLNAYTASNNTNCGGSGFPIIGLISDCSPAFADAANGDYRLANGRGVDWRVADQHYGPGAGSPVQPPPDSTPPGTSITSGPDNPTTSTSASFAFTATQSGSTFQCKLDNAAYAACTSPKAYSGLSVGSHTFSVRAIDPAGNTDATPDSRTWTIAAPDTAAPDTTITSGPDASTLSTSASFTFTASDASATFQCKLDAGSYAACTSPKAYSGLSTGAHTFTVRASDSAGNADATPATRTWTIAPDEDPGLPPPPADAPPTVALNAPANGAPIGSTLLLTPTVADDRGIGHIEFWLDDALLDRDDYPPFRTQIDSDRLSDWTHTISLRVFDTAGQAVSTAVRLRVVSYDWSTSVRRGADLSSVPVGDGVTRLQGETTPGGGVIVSLTPCTSQAGTITDRFALRGDDAGTLEMLYAQGDQCVLNLERLR
jgi:hypothetical protein